MLDPLWSFAPFCSKNSKSFEHPVNPVNPVITSHPCPVPAAKVFTTSFCLVLMADSTRSRGKCWFRPTDDLNHSGLDIYIIHILYIYILYMSYWLSYFSWFLMHVLFLCVPHGFWCFVICCVNFFQRLQQRVVPQWQPCCQAGEAYLSACEGWRRWAMVLMGTDGGDWINSTGRLVETNPTPLI